MRPVALLALLFLAGCQDRHWTLLGYRFGPMIDPSIRTVAVPVFRNIAEQTTPNRNLEADLTQAVIREINSRPGLRVVSDPNSADSVLSGTVVNINKLILNRNQQNQWRDGEILISATVVWKALDGRILSNRNRPKIIKPDVPAFDPTIPADPMVAPEEGAIPVLVTANGRLIPELGESNASAQQIALKALARQIVNLMEEPW